jgi:hypothetical protein
MLKMRSRRFGEMWQTGNGTLRHMGWVSLLLCHSSANRIRGQPLEALNQLEFRIVPAGTSGLVRDSIVCEGVIVADESNFAWTTRPFEFFTGRRREDGSYDVYRIGRSPAGDVIYCETQEPTTEKLAVARQWSIQEFLERDDVPTLAKGIIRDLCVPRSVRS